MEIRLPKQFGLYLLVILEILLLASCDGKKESAAMKKKCDACKKFTENFKKGMERTDRFMYDGGDADWEEKKLGSYATSEMRFIEITEDICENKEHDCHILLETKEEMLEDWWKHHQEEDPDLYQWFCLESYRVCCPDNTFGPDCTECPYGAERPCKGNGKCLGAGTRAGSGKCKCNAGYKGDLCDICKDGFFQVMKNDTHTSCKACHKSCTALCTALGPKGCKKCKAGWLWDDELGCQDVDECKAGDLTCEDDEFCENTEGSYKCSKCDVLCDRCLGPGKDKCVKCKTGNLMREDGCGDIDECEQEDICKTEHMSCHNVPGSYYCDCSEGYERVGGECMDKELSNNESDQASDESSGELESATLPEGENDAPETDGGIVVEGNANSADTVENGPNANPNLDEREYSREIPNSPGDLKDVSDQNGSKSLQEHSPDDSSEENVHVLNHEIPTPDTREEL